MRFQYHDLQPSSLVCYTSLSSCVRASHSHGFSAYQSLHYSVSSFHPVTSDFLTYVSIHNLLKSLFLCHTNSYLKNAFFPDVVASFVSCLYSTSSILPKYTHKSWWLHTIAVKDHVFLMENLHYQVGEIFSELDTVGLQKINTCNHPFSRCFRQIWLLRPIAESSDSANLPPSHCLCPEPLLLPLLPEGVSGKTRRNRLLWQTNRVNMMATKLKFYLHTANLPSVLAQNLWLRTPTQTTTFFYHCVRTCVVTAPQTRRRSHIKLTLFTLSPS